MYRVKKLFMRPLCLFRLHALYAEESLLMALSSGRSKRCKWCNRLVLKKEHRHA